MDNLGQLQIASAEGLRAWLYENHTQQESVWLVTFKKRVVESYVSMDQVLDELLCLGWVDGVRRKLDDDRTQQLIAPRRTQHWSKSYKDRAARLIAEDRMHAAGLEAIARSQRNGPWSFMDDVDAMIQPIRLGDDC